MKTVVITGSSGGLGLEMAKVFRRNHYNVVLNGTNPAKLEKAEEALKAVESSAGITAFRANVTVSSEVQALWDHAVAAFGMVDIWINNAGVNQPDKAVWELTEPEMDAMLDIDLRGAIVGSCVAMREMEKRHAGAIYNLEGYGSNDAHMLGLGMYGTTKRAVTYFTETLALESKERNTGVIVGRLSPGIMITDFTVKALGGQQNIDLPEKTKKFYNVVGDYPDIVAEFLVAEMLKNRKNDAHIEWLTTRKVAWRFMTSAFHKRDFFA